jgi:hypothetical protein
MRKISREVISAFLAGKPKRNGNTTTDGKVLRLYGNTIADKNSVGSIFIYDGGVRSATTKERLNSLLQLMKSENSYTMVANCIFQKNYEWLVRYDTGGEFNFQNGIVLGVKK